MGRLIVHQEKITDISAMVNLCPFGALEDKGGKLEINAGCKLCKLCVRKGQPGVMEFTEEDQPLGVDKSKWNGICVYVDHVEGNIHPVTLELLGKARELADRIKQPVQAIFIGSNIEKQAEELLHYGADTVYVIDNPLLKDFTIESYASAMEAYINQVHPTAILVGATSVGRQLAPRVAARFKTGLTADCTVLDIHENTDLVQIRPAFGGNIMAEILTKNTRPQLATVRYKVMNAPERSEAISGHIEKINVADAKLSSRAQVLGIIKKSADKTIEAAEVLVVAGRGLKKQDDIAMLKELADLLGGDIACTRPMAEAGWFDQSKQIGLSGRTVRPKLIITCGVSGSIQFKAGMSNSEQVVAINTDPEAPIFSVANYALVGDLYEIVPELIRLISKGGAKA